ncbi:MAG: hypothetical protein FWB78_04895 [Treponema sp.]|nr:hypothetical protein [Treponema sp.]
MNGKCIDCRFYDGKNCAINRTMTTPNYTCAYWASNTSSGTRKCKDCRFYSGGACAANYGNKVTPLYTCGRFSPFR